MGLFDFINRYKERKKAKKIEAINNKIGQNLYLLSQNKVTLMECVPTLGYFTVELLENDAEIESSYDIAATIYTSYYLMIFQKEISSHEHEKFIKSNFKDFVLLCIENIVNNSNALVPEDLNYLAQISMQSIRTMANKYNEKNQSLIETTINLAFEEYNKTYGFDISEREKILDDILKAITEKYIDALDDYDKSTLLYQFERKRVINIHGTLDFSTNTTPYRLR